MRVLDLFAGIGGFSLGLERAGFETVAFCEIEPYAQKVLAKHWPGVPIYDDVRQLSKDELPDDIGLICGGYPCQPFSTAGKQRGTEDDRHLWPEFARLIREIRPRWVIGENVAGHIGMGLDQVLSDLEGQGYSWEAFVIPACAVNAIHRRDRVWIVANSAGVIKPGGEYEGAAEGGRETPPKGAGFSSHADSLPDPDAMRRGREVGRDVSRNGRQQESLERYGIGIPASEPVMGGGTDGVPRRLDRLRCLGNAVVPQIPELIGRAIMEAERA